MNLIEAVKNWGLNEKEAKVYLALLQLGMTTAYNVANKSGLKKPTTYVILEQLQGKGMVRKIPRAKKLLFEAESPQHIWQIVEERMLWAKRALPELLAVKKEKNKKVGVAYYEGINGFREIYYRLVKEMDKQAEIFGFYARADDISMELLKFWDELNAFQEKIGVKRRVITTVNEYYQQNEAIMRMLDSQKMKMKGLLQDKYDSHISMEVYGDKVLIASHRYLQAVVLENADVALALKQVFAMVWDLVEKDRQGYISYSNIK